MKPFGFLTARLSSFCSYISRFMGTDCDESAMNLQGSETYKGLRIVTPELVRGAHERGQRVDVWTIDPEPDMRRLLGFGVDGIMTDRPDVLARVLRGE
jgi:glycerophosphoryl diester phosphodiesterase